MINCFHTLLSTSTGYRHYNLVAAAAMEGGDFDDEFENPKVGLNSG